MSSNSKQPLVFLYSKQAKLLPMVLVPTFYHARMCVKDGSPITSENVSRESQERGTPENSSSCNHSIWGLDIQQVLLFFWAEQIWLVVEPTHLKNISQIGNLPQIGVKIKNIWNHHLEIEIPSLKLTDKAPENGGSWNTFSFPFWGKRPIFGCELFVLGSN